MIGRSGSSAGSWVAASQSLRIGRWRLSCAWTCSGMVVVSRNDAAAANSAPTGRGMPRLCLPSVAPRIVDPFRRVADAHILPRRQEESGMANTIARQRDIVDRRLLAEELIAARHSVPAPAHDRRPLAAALKAALGAGRREIRRRVEAANDGAAA